jgi:aryl-alcohol dehydrogenase-like predicted oxidoreductase
MDGGGSRLAPAVAAGPITLGGELTVARMGFGAMRLTGPGIIGPHADPARCRRVVARAVELGVTFIDTADSYGPDVSEELIAETLHPYRRGLVIGTKAGLLRPGPHQWTRDGRPEHLRAQCEGSLRRLRIERIDLFQLHRIDSAVPEVDQFETLKALRDEGKVRLVGLSEVSVDEITRARQVVPIASVQNKYNVGERGSEAVVDYCTREGIAFLPWYPLGAGRFDDADVLDPVAARHGATRMQVALAWLLARSPMMLPIPGTSRVDHLEENVAAAQLRLSADDLASLG